MSFPLRFLWTGYREAPRQAGTQIFETFFVDLQHPREMCHSIT
jgi:hypothetical protein